MICQEVSYAVKLSAQLPVQPVNQSLGPYEEKLKPALAYIQEHYSEPITIARLASLCGFSQVHFMNILKKPSGPPVLTIWWDTVWLWRPWICGRPTVRLRRLP